MHKLTTQSDQSWGRSFLNRARLASKTFFARHIMYLALISNAGRNTSIPSLVWRRRNVSLVINTTCDVFPSSRSYLPLIAGVPQAPRINALNNDLKKMEILKHTLCSPLVIPAFVPTQIPRYGPPAERGRIQGESLAMKKPTLADLLYFLVQSSNMMFLPSCFFLWLGGEALCHRGHVRLAVCQRCSRHAGCLALSKGRRHQFAQY